MLWRHAIVSHISKSGKDPLLTRDRCRCLHGKKQSSRVLRGRIKKFCHLTYISHASLSISRITVTLPQSSFPRLLYIVASSCSSCESILGTLKLQSSSQILKHLCAFSPPQCWFGHYSGLSASKYAWLNIGEREGTLQWKQKCEE